MFGFSISGFGNVASNMGRSAGGGDTIANVGILAQDRTRGGSESLNASRPSPAATET